MVYVSLVHSVISIHSRTFECTEQQSWTDHLVKMAKMQLKPPQTDEYFASCLIVLND